MSILKRRKRRGHDDAAVDMTPMLDIVFIMLIFFIVSANFLDETAIELRELPPSPPITPPTGQSISIYVDAANAVSVNNERTLLQNVTVTVESLMATKPGANILLIADAKASLDPVVYIQDQMKLAGRPTVIEIRKPVK